jgi:hypothetical protein
MKQVAVIGASLGGLIAAAELRDKGFGVRIVERGKTVAGLYGAVDTPFGTQELGMHVMYVSPGQLDRLRTIFGAASIEAWEGYSVDIGASHWAGRTSFDSVYPDIRPLPDAGRIREQLLATSPGAEAHHALDEVVRRFGSVAGTGIYAPILKKLWRLDANLLAPGAIQTYFDLRRIVAFGKEEADQIKKDSWLDSTIANPIQSQPAGGVYGGRHAVRFKVDHRDLETRAAAWLEQADIHCEYNKGVQIADGRFMLDGIPLDETFDGCIVATPVAGMAPSVGAALDQVEMSIFYLQLEQSMLPDFPSYYILCHAPELHIARIVNYEAYHKEARGRPLPVIAVEVLHAIAATPVEHAVAREVQSVLPSANIKEVFRLPRSLKVASPSLANAAALDALIAGMETKFADNALFFTGMRTDKGVFFSHHTIGLAHDAAMECIERLS